MARSDAIGELEGEVILMRHRSIVSLVTLLVVVGLVLAPAAAGVLAQADHSDALDAPHATGVSETAFGAAATTCEVPAASPRLAGGDVSAAPAVQGGATGAYVPDAAHSDLVDAPHAIGTTETPFGAEATECAGPFE